jgi:hypothetical protein
MRSWKAVGLALAAAAAAAPLAAQPTESRAERIAREIREAAEDIRTVRDAVDESVSDVRFRGRDRYAIDRCRPSVERYGRMRVDEVRRHKRRSLRVYGTVGGDRYDRDRYDDRYDRNGYAMRSFTCTVDGDGRVKLKTKKLRR